MSDGETTLPLNQNDQAQKQADPKSQAKPGAKPEAKPKAETKTELVTYLPDEGDPSSVKWDGHTLHANVPKAIDVARHGEMIEKARTNRFFKVGPFDAAKDSVKAEETVLPKTSDQYRAYCVAWLKTLETDTQYVERWMGEEKLRESCGVGSDDIEWLSSLIEPKRAELKKRALG